MVEAAGFYESRSIRLGFAFLEEVERSVEQITETPEAYQRIGKRVRRKPMWRFPYNIIYAVYGDRIRVVALAHQKRRPFYWRQRLEDPPENLSSV